MFALPPVPGAAPSALPPPRPRSPSHVRLRSAPSPAPALPEGEISWLDAEALLDELGDEQLNLSIALSCLERAAERGPRDPSARAALRCVRGKVTDLLALRDALADVLELAADRRMHRLLVTDAPLSDYLRGLYAWSQAIVRALDALASSLHTLTPDWARLRARIEEADNFHFDELRPAIRADLTSLATVARGFRSPPKVPELAAALVRLFDAATALSASLDQRFG